MVLVGICVGLAKVWFMGHYFTGLLLAQHKNNQFPQSGSCLRLDQHIYRLTQNGLVDLICERYGPSVRKQFDIIGEGTNTLNLLQRAEAHQHNEAYGYQHIWIIYDKDDFPADAFDNTVNRCDSLNKRFQSEGHDIAFHAIWSNQCIELWFLLHFDYLQADIDREQYRTILSNHLGRHYEKNDAELFMALLPHLERAIRNAKRQMNNYPKESPPSQKAPATNVYKLVEHLREYIQ